MSDDVCPCGGPGAYAACCGRFHGGEVPATALELMQSRYAAYVLGKIEYLIETHDPATRGAMDVASARTWSRTTTWEGLEIVMTAKGAAHDSTGVVEFVARGKTKGKPFVHRERSRFHRHQGRWYYVDGR